MDRIAALKAFVAVVDEGGFAAAARALGLSRSGVNRLVMGLEDQLGAQLLTRSTRRVNPTSTGAAFHARAVRILEALDEAERAVRAEDTEATGDLAISAPVSFGTAHIAPLMADFMARHPALRVRLDLSDRTVDLFGEGYDLAVRMGQPREDANLVDFRLCQSRLVLCAAPALAEDPSLALGPAALRTLPCLDYVVAGEGRPWRLAGAEEVRLVPNRVLISNNGEVLRDAALAGRGIALLPTFIVGPALADGRLVEVLPDWRATTLTLAVVYPPARHLSAKVRVFHRLHDGAVRRCAAVGGRAASAARGWSIGGRGACSQRSGCASVALNRALIFSEDPNTIVRADGAVEKTRTSTGCPTATSTLRVYQFRHDRVGWRLSSSLLRPFQAARCRFRAIT